MKTRILVKSVASRLFVAAFALLALPVVAADATKGTLTVDGKPVDITHAYAYVDKTFNEGKDAVVVVLSDAPVPAEAVQDDYARKQLAAAGKLHYVELMVGSDKKAIHYEVQHKRFGVMMQPSGDDSDHVFEARTIDGKTIAGRTRTTSPQKSFDDVPYVYDITFSAQIEPAKHD